MVIELTIYGHFNLIRCDPNSLYELKPKFDRIIWYNQSNYLMNFALNFIWIHTSHCVALMSHLIHTLEIFPILI